MLLCDYYHIMIIQYHTSEVSVVNVLRAEIDQSRRCDSLHRCHVGVSASARSFVVVIVCVLRFDQ